MGIRVEIGGIDYECLDYEVREDATPLGVHDSSQSVGSISVSIRLPEEFHPGRNPVRQVVQNTLWNPVLTSSGVGYNPSEYSVEDVEITDDPIGPGRGVRITRLPGSPEGSYFTLPQISQVAPEGNTWEPLTSRYNSPIRSRDLVLRVKAESRSAAEADVVPASLPPGLPGYPDPSIPVTGLPLPLTWRNVTCTASAPETRAGIFDFYDRYRLPVDEPLSLSPRISLPGVGDTVIISSAMSIRGGSPSPSGPFSPLPTGDNPPFERGGSDQLTTDFGWLADRGGSPTVNTLKGQVSYFQDPVEESGGLGFEGQEVTLTDSNRGTTSGTVISQRFNSDGTVDLECESSLSSLNSYRVVASPSDLTGYGDFQGTLGEAVRYYAALASVPYIYVDPEVRDRKVSFPSWEGESWFYLKQLASSQGCEISYVYGRPVFRKIRHREVPPGRWISRSVSSTPGDLAESVEVVNLRTQTVRDEVVLSPVSEQATTFEVVVFGEDGYKTELRDHVVEADFDLLYVRSPSSAGSEGAGSSWVTWEDGTSQVNTSSFVTAYRDVSAPRNIFVRFPGFAPTTRGSGAIISAQIGSSGGIIPGLTLVGGGTRTLPETIRLASGVPARDAESEVGTVIESPFLEDSVTAIRAGKYALQDFAAPKISLSGEISYALDRGESGVTTDTLYSEVQTYASGDTYSEFPESRDAGLDNPTYEVVRDFLRIELNRFGSSQEFGNIAGSRVWDEGTRRWYRIRTASVRPGMISFEADDDLTLGEAVEPWVDAGLSYQQVEVLRVPEFLPSQSNSTSSLDKASYQQVERMGVARG